MSLVVAGLFLIGLACGLRRCLPAVSLVVAGLFLYGLACGLRRCLPAVSRVVAGLFFMAWPAACADDCLIWRFSLISGFVYYVVVYRVGGFLLSCSLDSCRRNRCKKKKTSNTLLDRLNDMYVRFEVHANCAGF